MQISDFDKIRQLVGKARSMTPSLSAKKIEKAAFRVVCHADVPCTVPAKCSSIPSPEAHERLLSQRG